MSISLYKKRRRSIKDEINELEDKVKKLKQEDIKLQRIIKHPYLFNLHDVSKLDYNIVEICLSYLIEQWCYCHEWYVGSNCILCTENDMRKWRSTHNALVQIEIRQHKYYPYVIFLSDDDMKLVMYWNNPEIFYPYDISSVHDFGGELLQNSKNIFRFKCYLSDKNGALRLPLEDKFPYQNFNLFILPRGSELRFVDGYLHAMCNDDIYDSWFLTRLGAIKTDNICDYINSNKI